jgi:hypothetical protein
LAVARASPSGVPENDSSDNSSSNASPPQPPSNNAPPRGAALTPRDAAAVAARWAPLLPPAPADRNRLLSRRMRALTHPDPFAYELFKQDGRDYM